MLRIGLTGGIGSGKSSVVAEFKKLGVGIIDLDEIAREVVALGTPALTKISDHFGQSVLDSSGALDRGTLREIIFNDNSERAWLENLLHPAIRERQLQLEAEVQSPYCVIEIPLLVENLESQQVDRILVVEVPESLQIERTMHRSSLSEQEVLKIIDNQATIEERRKVADDLIDNSGPAEHLAAQVEALHRKYMEIAAQSAS
jgi:dephospho-CoA kinase